MTCNTRTARQDGLLNDVPQSRWSCEELLDGDITECYITFDLGSSQTLSKITICERHRRSITTVSIVASIAGGSRPWLCTYS